MGAALNPEHLTRLPKWITPEKYAEIAGTTERAIERKRQEGVWRENVEWIKAPDGRIRINWKAVDQWIESGAHSH